MEPYRQGDVDFHPKGFSYFQEDIPKDAKKIKHNGQYILAYGEHTGHRHVLTLEKPQNMIVWEDTIGNIYLELKSKGFLSHGKHREENGCMVAPVGDPQVTGEDRHKNYEVGPGVYKVGIEEKYNPCTKRLERVID